MLEAYARQYKVSTKADDSELYQALVMRVAPIPVSLALAQAAIESGWGQSRFTASGNALFGQWVWNDKEGIKPNRPAIAALLSGRFQICLHLYAPICST